MNADISQTAALLSDPGRAAMLLALMDGTSLPAGQLAMIGNIAPQTASSHLSKLVSGRLLVVESRGRHRYYRLANSEVAQAIESLMAIAPRSDSLPVLPRAGNEQFLRARTCYSHLAGRLAVQITQRLLERDVLRRHTAREFAVTKHGCDWFAGLGIEFTSRQLKQHGFAKRCLDWTERRDHIAGKLGVMLLDRFYELKWFAPIRDTRALRVTLQGEQKLYDYLRINGRHSVA